ncbi:MAG: type II toxin-antitoxin system HicB family antitoxin [Acidobacteria bacterium]|nr:type II toxin-antitoxin system HicB family antitoxin [Acidobacteriota bacterium]
MRSFCYPATLKRGDRAGRFTVTFRDLPEAITWGDGLDDTLWQAADCLEEAIAGRIRRGDKIPVASRPKRREHIVPIPAPMAAKAALYLAMREARLTTMELARRLRCNEREVRRMLDPRHPTKLLRIETALSALGRRLVLALQEAA